MKSLPSLGQSLPLYSLCHLREVASRGNDLPTHTGQRLSEEGSKLWTRQRSSVCLANIGSAPSFGCYVTSEGVTHPLDASIPFYLGLLQSAKFTHTPPPTA